MSNGDAAGKPGVSPALPPVPSAFDWERFRADAHETINFIVDVQQRLARRELPVRPTVDPGFLRSEFGPSAPEEPQPWGEVLGRIEGRVIPGMTHWQHPDFLAYFPAMMSPPALLGDLIASSFNTPMFTWVAAPSATELEMVVMDWLVRAFHLPDAMLWSNTGGGVLQASATEAMIVTMLAARNRAVERQLSKLPTTEDPDVVARRKSEVLSKLAVYYSDQSHFCVEKSASVLAVPFRRKIPSLSAHDGSGNLPVNTEALQRAVEADLAAGLVPFYVSGNFGATGVCAIDPLDAIGKLARQFGLWFNVDAAYAGAACVCEEYRRELTGMEYYDSILINGSKWFNLLFNSNFMFFREKQHVVASLNASGVYLANQQTESGSVVDLKDYHLGLGRPFRSLKLYTTLSSFGLEGMRATIRRHCILASTLEAQLRRFMKPAAPSEPLFEIVRRAFGLVCFGLHGAPQHNGALLELLNSPTFGLYLVSTTVNGRVVLRVSISYPALGEADVEVLADKIRRAALHVLTESLA